MVVWCKWVNHQVDGKEEEEGKTFVCDKHDRAVTCMFCRDLHLALMFSGLQQKDLFKGK